MLVAVYQRHYHSVGLFTPHLEAFPHFPIFPVTSLYPDIFLCTAPQTPLYQQWPLLSFLVSAFIPEYLLMSKDFELRACNERENVIFACLCLGYFTLHDLF